MAPEGLTSQLLQHAEGRETEAPEAGGGQNQSDLDALRRGEEGASSDRQAAANSWGFWRLVRALILSSRVNVALFVGMAAVRISRELVLANFMAKILGTFYSSLTSRKVNAFADNTQKYIVLVCISAAMDSVAKYLSEILYIRWRHSLTDRLNVLYLEQDRYYVLMHRGNGGEDNPDQRIASDARLFCEVLAKVCDQLIAAPATIVIYSFCTYASIGLIGPAGVWGFFSIGLTVNLILASAAVATSRRRLQGMEGDFRLMHVGIKDRSEQIAMLRGEQLERAKLSQSLGKLLGEQKTLAFRHFCVKIISDAFQYLGALMNYVLIAIAIFFPSPWSIPIPDLDDPSKLAALISEVSYNCLMIIQGFTLLVNSSADLGDLFGYAARISSLFEAFERIEKQGEHSQVPRRSDLSTNWGHSEMVGLSSSEATSRSPKNAPKINQVDVCLIGENPSQNDSNPSLSRAEADLMQQQHGHAVEEARDSSQEIAAHLTPGCSSNSLLVGKREFGGQAVCVEGLCVSSPGGSELFSGLSFCVSRGDSLLIVGPSGCGKTALVRTLAGLWGGFSGVVQVPSDSDISYIPQFEHGISLEPRFQKSKPVQVTYPHDSAHMAMSTPSHIRMKAIEALHAVHLSHLINRFDFDEVQSNWAALLSPGELQRLAFARLLFAPSHFAVLDESTSSLPEQTEEHLYKLCIEHGITIISVGHRTSLRKYHRRVLEILGDGQWRISSLH